MFWVKVAVSVLVLYLIFRGTDLGKITGLMAKSSKPLWAAALFLMILSQLISTFRWRILLRPLDFDLPWSRVFTIYFTGMFFSLFLPTIVGGDGVKTFYIADDWRRVPAALYTLLADRTIGLAAMLLFTLFGLPVVWNIWPRWLVVGLPLSVLLLYLLLVYLPVFSSGLLMLSRRLREVPSERLFVYWERPEASGKAWLLSMLIHACLVLSHILLAEALGMGIPLLAWAVIYPLSALAGFLPISLSGVGPREAAYVYLTGLYGVARETALAFGIMWFSIVLVNGLAGGIVYVFGREMRIKDATGED